MARMMEALESRQMFSVSVADATALPAEPTGVAVDPSASTDVVVEKKVRSSPVLMQVCATGQHIREATITH
jgi:type VI protein secretion system component Hcp